MELAVADSRLGAQAITEAVGKTGGRVMKNAGSIDFRQVSFAAAVMAWSHSTTKVSFQAEQKTAACGSGEYVCCASLKIALAHICRSARVLARVRRPETPQGWATSGHARTISKKLPASKKSKPFAGQRIEVRTPFGESPINQQFLPTRKLQSPQALLSPGAPGADRRG